MAIWRTIMLVDIIKVDKTLQNRLFEKCLFANGVWKMQLFGQHIFCSPITALLITQMIRVGGLLTWSTHVTSDVTPWVEKSTIYWFQPSVFDSWGAILKTNTGSPHSASRIFWLVDSWTCTSRLLCHYKIITYMIYTYVVIWLYILHHNVLQTACSNRMGQF